MTGLHHLYLSRRIVAVAVGSLGVGEQLEKLTDTCSRRDTAARTTVTVGESTHMVLTGHHLLHNQEKILQEGM